MLELAVQDLLVGKKLILFDEYRGRVFIEAKKPGLVIGHGASTLRQITEIIGWSPTVNRFGYLPRWKRTRIF